MDDNTEPNQKNENDEQYFKNINDFTTLRQYFVDMIKGSRTSPIYNFQSSDEDFQENWQGNEETYKMLEEVNKLGFLTHDSQDGKPDGVDGDGDNQVIAKSYLVGYYPHYLTSGLGMLAQTMEDNGFKVFYGTHFYALLYYFGDDMDKLRNFLIPIVERYPNNYHKKTGKHLLSHKGPFICETSVPDGMRFIGDDDEIIQSMNPSLRDKFIKFYDVVIIIDETKKRPMTAKDGLLTQLLTTCLRELSDEHIEKEYWKFYSRAALIMPPAA